MEGTAPLLALSLDRGRRVLWEEGLSGWLAHPLLYSPPIQEEKDPAISKESAMVMGVATTRGCESEAGGADLLLLLGRMRYWFALRGRRNGRGTEV